MDEFAVYVLYSVSADRLYVGYSANSLDRFHWHNEKSRKGFTARYRPWSMVHVELFSSKEEALKREKMLKGGQGRAWIRSEVIPKMKTVGFISA